MTTRTLLRLLLSSTCLLMSAPALADGILIPRPPDQTIRPIREIPNFAIKHHRVEVTIQDQLATTSVDQLFYNPSRQILEGTYLFPVPEGANISRFSMDIDGKMQGAELLNAEEARQIYEQIVRQRIDPGLLEYAGQNLYRARVFPIPAQGDKAIKLKYEQVLSQKADLHHYRYGLGTEKFSSQNLKQASITIDLKSKQPLKNIYSPSHDISVQRLSDNHAKISWEAANVKPDTDFELYYSTSPDPIGASLMTYNPPGEDGYFMLLASPQVKWEKEKPQPKAITFVVDTSGSMSGEKIEQTRDALIFNLNQLAPQDRFQLLPFSDGVRPFTPSLVPANSRAIQQAIAEAKNLLASGGTDINSAVLQALQNKPGEGLPMIVFLTDGDPTVGETNFQTILKNVKQQNKQNARLFVFGVGNDVNIPFLDKLSLQNYGSSEFVRPEENIEVKVSRLFSQIANPILSQLKLSYGSAQTQDILPQTLPDFFKGSQLMVVGRYRQAGKHTVTLNGQVNGQNRNYTFKNLDFASAQTDHQFLPRLWASRKIGYLMDQIRLQGNNKELVEEVIRLSKQYGIITEFTSFLVREELDLRAPAASAPLLERAESKFDDSLGAEKGAWAISQSRNANKLQNQSAPAAANDWLDAEGKTESVASQVKYIAQRAFYLKKGVWQDSLSADKLPILKVKTFGPLYFELARQKELMQILALGEQIEFVWRKHLITIGSEGQSELSPTLKQQLSL